MKSPGAMEHTRISQLTLPVDLTFQHPAFQESQAKIHTMGTLRVPFKGDLLRIVCYV